MKGQEPFSQWSLQAEGSLFRDHIWLLPVYTSNMEKKGEAWPHPQAQRWPRCTAQIRGAAGG